MAEVDASAATALTPSSAVPNDAFFVWDPCEV